jgi:hypothetical protein
MFFFCIRFHDIKISFRKSISWIFFYQQQREKKIKFSIYSLFASSHHKIFIKQKGGTYYHKDSHVI